MGIKLLKKCEEVWVYGIENPSEGMRAEMEIAKSLDIPVKDAVDIYMETFEQNRLDQQHMSIGLGRDGTTLTLKINSDISDAIDIEKFKKEFENQPVVIIKVMEGDYCDGQQS